MRRGKGLAAAAASTCHDPHSQQPLTWPSTSQPASPLCITPPHAQAEPRFTNLASTTGNAAVAAATAAVKQHGQQQEAVTKPAPAPAPPASMDGWRMGSCKALGGALAHGAHALDEDSEHESPFPGTTAAVAGAGPSSSGEMASSTQGSTLSRAGSPLPSGLIPAAAAAAAVAGKPGRSSVTVSAPPLLPTAALFAVPASPWAPALTTAAAPRATTTAPPLPVNVATDATARVDRGGRASGEAAPSAAPSAAAPACTPVATEAEAETSAASTKSRSIVPTTATAASTAVADGALTNSRGVAGAARPSIQAFAASGRFVSKPYIPPAVKGAPKVEER